MSSYLLEPMKRNFLRTFLYKLFKLDEDTDSTKVIQSFEQVLQDAYIISSTSLHNVLVGKLDRKRRMIQLVMHFFNWILIPRYFSICILYLVNEETRKFYLYYLLDYMETLEILGRTMNAIYATAMIPIVWTECF